MKTSEFIEKVEKLSFIYTVLNDNDYTIIVRSFKGVLMQIREHEYFMIDNFYPAFQDLNDSQRDLLMNVVIDYFKTPISERREKTIEDKAREYIREYASDDLSFESARDFLECCHLYFNDEDKNRKYLIDAHLSNYSQERLKECSEIYDWYHENSNNFIKMWLEVSEDE